MSRCMREEAKERVGWRETYPDPCVLAIAPELRSAPGVRENKEISRGGADKLLSWEPALDVDAEPDNNDDDDEDEEWSPLEVFAILLEIQIDQSISDRRTEYWSRATDRVKQRAATASKEVLPRRRNGRRKKIQEIRETEEAGYDLMRSVWDSVRFRIAFLPLNCALL